MDYIVHPGPGFTGTSEVPGDKSISHRSVIFGSIADGTTNISGLLEGQDVLATISAFRAMGVSIEGPDNGHLTIHGVGLHGLQAPDKPLNMGNSGTAMRLLIGLLAGQKFSSQLVGDSSLSQRPMQRVAEPLQKAGALIETHDGCPPVVIQPSNSGLIGLYHELKIASAQIKSAILLAGLYANTATTVVEPAPTRDHSERMLRGFGCDIETHDLTAILKPVNKLTATSIQVPGDISSAAFFLCAAAMQPGARVRINHIGLNPTRTGILNILRAMGAAVEIDNEHVIAGEMVGDITVTGRGLSAIDVPEQWVPLAIDEFPMICVIAATAKGITRVRGAAELRVKESDRISAAAEGLKALGIHVEETADGLDVHGGVIAGGTVNSHHDHRISMAFAMAGLVATHSIKILDCRNVATSFPNFVETARFLGLNIEVLA
ncbi:MAG: 3-phosphoshikimate 1-carboxyvinyltransferase [Parasphingorhabdus sp.]|jgi:3-phosphoshikimate 1-carboxyvinyltransferase